MTKPPLDSWPEIVADLEDTIAGLRAQHADTAAFLDGMAHSLAAWGHEGAAGECREWASNLKGETSMNEQWKTYRKVQTTKMRPYQEGEDLSSVSVDPGYTPKQGDMLASDGKTSWLINQNYFMENYELVDEP